MKVIEITYPNGDIYSLDLMLVAKDRADYYKKEDNLTDKEYQEEIDLVLNDSYEGIDWLKNNMKYDDICHKLVLVRKCGIDTSDFCNFEMEIKQDKQEG